MTKARFEIVHTPGRREPFHARFVAGNGETVWWTENYVDQADADRAIALLQQSEPIQVRVVEEDDS